MSLEHTIEKHGPQFGEDMRLIQRLILDAHPGIYESTKWGLPFFSLRKNIIYMDIQKGKPIMAFYRGHEFGEMTELLDFTGRKFVGHFSLENLNESRLETICMLIDIAIELDQAK